MVWTDQLNQRKSQNAYNTDKERSHDLCVLCIRNYIPAPGTDGLDTRGWVAYSTGRGSEVSGETGTRGGTEQTQPPRRAQHCPCSNRCGSSETGTQHLATSSLRRGHTGIRTRTLEQAFMAHTPGRPVLGGRPLPGQNLNGHQSRAAARHVESEHHPHQQSGHKDDLSREIRKYF